jgi:hypothetical protein
MRVGAHGRLPSIRDRPVPLSWRIGRIAYSFAPDLAHLMHRLLTSLTVAVAIAVAPLARAATDVPGHIFLEDMTSPELQDTLRRGATTIIIPVGGTEQNGPHMALGKHNVRVKVLAGRIATTLGKTIVAPVLPYVPEGQHCSPSSAHALGRHDQHLGRRLQVGA